MFELVVGEVGAILGGLEEDRDFPDLVLEAWLETTEAARAEASTRSAAARRGKPAASRAPRRSTTSLFGEDFETA